MHLKYCLQNMFNNMVEGSGRFLLPTVHTSYSLRGKKFKFFIPINTQPDDGYESGLFLFFYSKIW